jgi:hypothetical protein
MRKHQLAKSHYYKIKSLFIISILAIVVVFSGQKKYQKEFYTNGQI